MFSRKLFQLHLTKKIEVKRKIAAAEVVDYLYVGQLILASILATLGLLQNSVAIVIGAMLVAPLFRPIQSLAYALVLNDWPKVIRSFLILTISTIAGVVIGGVITLLLPNPDQTTEIIARTAPNILDLIVALVSAVIVFLALKSDRLLDSVAGVAMAAALLPPIAVIGIELALLDFASAEGAALLYLTNVIAIIFVGVIVLYLYGFDAKEKDKEVSSKIVNIVTLVGLTIILAIPLSSSLIEISQRATIKHQASEILQEIITETLPQSQLAKVEVIAIDSDKISLLAQLKLAESEQLFTETKEQVLDQLGAGLNSDVEVQFELIRVAEVVSKETSLNGSVSLESRITSILVRQIPEAHLVSINQQLANEDGGKHLTVLIGLPANTGLIETKKEQLTEIINGELVSDYEITWLVLNTANPVANEPSQVQKLQEKILTNIIPKIREILPRNFEVIDMELTPQNGKTQITKVKDIQSFSFFLHLEYPESSERELANIQESITSIISENIDQPVEISIKATKYSQFSTTTKS